MDNWDRWNRWGNGIPDLACGLILTGIVIGGVFCGLMLFWEWLTEGG